MQAGELMLPPALALQFLDGLASLGVGILGVNTWYAQGDRFAESLVSADMSSLVGTANWVQRSLEEARTFIKMHLPPETVAVSFVLADA